MKRAKIFAISILLGAQAISLMALEIHITEKSYSIYQDGRDITNPVNIIAKFSVSSSVGNLEKGPISVILTPNKTHGNIIQTSDILDSLPHIAIVCTREFPDQPIEAFSVDIRVIEDLWEEYREFVLRNMDDAPGEVEFKSNWFQQKSLAFSRSNQKIAAIQKTISNNVKSLANTTIMIPEEIHFAKEAIGISWGAVGESPGLYIVSSPVISFIPK